MLTTLCTDPSKHWWGYLGLRSNPALLADTSGDRPTRAVYFEDPAALTGEEKGSPGSTKYFQIFWDGIPDERHLLETRSVLGAEADVTALVVGDVASEATAGYEAMSLYPPGPLHFGQDPPFDKRSASIVRRMKAKTWLMPFKNILQKGVNKREGLDLLLGPKRIVFCGSYRLVPQVLEQYRAWNSVDPALLDVERLASSDATPPLAEFCENLRERGRMLADLRDGAEVHPAFLNSVLRLLAREYFIERVRASGMPFFVNGYDTGLNINVYTTPFYRQHVYLDFGSMAGPGNYPRLADLAYFGKTTVEVNPFRSLDEVLSQARAGTLDVYFAQQWDCAEPAIVKAMA